MYNVLSMKNSILVIFAVLVIASLLPFTEGSPQKRSMDITSLTINFDRPDAIFTVNYDFGTFPKLYILLLGSKSIEPKLRSIFSEFDYEILKMDQDKAVLKVKGISRQEKGYYLHESRKFGESIDTIIIFTTDSPRAKEYSNLNATPATFYRS